MIDTARLRSALDYNPDTGVLTWASVNKHSSKRVGDVAGCVDKSGTGPNYVVIWIDNKSYRAHRLAFQIVTGLVPVGEIDHRNGDGTDNRWCNLRDVPQSINQKNKRKMSNNTSGITGVSYSRTTRKWQAYVSIDGKMKHLGWFSNKEDAANARKQKLSAIGGAGYTDRHGS